MIEVRPYLDTSLVDAVRDAQSPSHYNDAAVHICRERNGMQTAPELKLEDFNNESKKSLLSLATNVGEHLTEIAQRATRFFPCTDEHYHHRVRILMVPYGTKCFGAGEGLQVFSLMPNADPLEVALFLSHVFYHEVTPLFNTKRSEEAFANLGRPDNYRYGLLHLIRNEGIANYLASAELRAFYEEHPSYAYRYFTYARSLFDEASVKQAFGVLRRVMSALQNGISSEKMSALDKIILDRRLSVINVTGHHIAQNIAERFGPMTLRNCVYKRDVSLFYDLYRQSGGAIGAEIG